MKRKRILSLTLALLLALAIIPQTGMTAFADNGNPALVEGTGVLATKANGDKDAIQILHYGGTSWYVIGYNGEGNIVAAKSGVATLLQKGVGESVMFNADSEKENANAYDGSGLQNHIDTTVWGSFDDKEKKAVSERKLLGGSGNRGSDTYNSNNIKGSDVTASLWPLSVAEAEKLPKSLRAIGSGFYWWLRSPGGDDDRAAYVDYDGTVESDGDGYDVEEFNDVRPAFDLNLSSVLFTSAAAGGKSSGDAGADALKAQSEEKNTTNEWKVTVKDEAHSEFAIIDSCTGYDFETGVATVAYKNAQTGIDTQTGNGEYISAVIKNSDGEITYYGRIAAPTSATGSVTINTNEKLKEGDTLYVFNELYHTDTKTDYASELKVIKLEPVLGHTWNTEWSADSDKHFYECSVCQARKDEENHQWNDGKALTVDDKSFTLYTCTICNFEKEVLNGGVYAIFDSSDRSLTFKYEEETYEDDQVVGTKTYYTGVEDEVYSMFLKPSWLAKHNLIEKVDFQADVKPRSCAYWFSDCQNLERVLNASRLDTSDIECMDYMFYNCSSLVSLDVSKWDTSEISDMDFAFDGCSSLPSLDVSGWKTSQVANMRKLFSDCKKLTSLNVSGWDTSRVRDMAYMFQGCSKLASLDVSGWNTSNVADMSSMFDNCRNLASLDVSGWDTSRVRSMCSMFNGCSSLEFLDLSDWDPHAAKEMNYMFSGCASLSSVRFGERFSFKGDSNDPSDYAVLPDAPESLGCKGRWICESATGAEGVTAADLCVMYPNATTPEYAIGTYVWEGSTKVAVFDSEDSSLTFRIETKKYNDGDTDDTKTYYTGFEGKKYTYNEPPAWLDHKDDIKKVDFRVSVEPKSCAFWFYHFNSLEEVSGANKLYTSGVSSMESMFYSCFLLGSLDVSRWNTFKVTKMNSMFFGCSSLSSLDVSKWDTSNVTDMNSMFSGCSKLASVKLGWNFSFRGASSNPDWYALLPDAPDDEAHTGKWINSSDPDTLGVTASDLRDRFPASANSSYGPGTYVWEVCIHNMSETPAKAETCTEAGNGAYWTCEKCGKHFSDEQGTNKIEESSWIIPAKGHSMTHHEGVPATCTENGILKYYACERCSKNFSDEQGTNKIEESSWIIPAKGHSMTHHEEVPATCTENGILEYYACERCSKDFSDEEGTAVLDDIVDPMTGHAYGQWEKLDDAQHRRVCSHDSSHVEKEDHKWDNGKARTKGAGSVTIFTCTVCKATKEVENKGKTYQLSSGANGSWTKGSTASLTFTFKNTEDDSETFDHFTGIKVDGKDIPKKDAFGKANWTKQRGSVIIELKPSYLETLSVGKHKLTASFDDGDDVTTEFTVNAKATTPTKADTTSGNSTTTAPKTGDASNMLLWFMLICASLFVMFQIISLRNRRFYDR